MSKYRFSKDEEKKYVFLTNQDRRIYHKLKKLGLIRLDKEEKRFVELLKTQLEDDWRTPLEKFVDRLLRNKSRK